MLTNHNSRNRWCQILRRTIWIVRIFMVLEGLLIVRAIIFCFVLYIFLLQIFIQQVCPLSFPVASLYVWYVRCISFMNIKKIKRKMKKTMQKLKMIPEVLHGIMISSVDSIQLCSVIYGLNRIQTIRNQYHKKYHNFLKHSKIPTLGQLRLCLCMAHHTHLHKKTLISFFLRNLSTC